MTQPSPSKSSRSFPVSPRVDAIISACRAKGRREYGQELHTFNGRTAPLDAAEEAFGLMEYAVQWAIEREEMVEEIERLRAELAIWHRDGWK